MRSEENTLVVAGPGAGKTELLAQRACFLLQTGTCADPQRILAISLKRDAARNLRERVGLRCGRDLNARFDSYTFDSFSKDLVERFLPALPEWCRPGSDYRVLPDLNERMAADLVAAIPSSMLRLTDAERHGLSRDALWKAFIGRPLPDSGTWTNASDEERAASALWQYLLRDGGKSALGFHMLARLAEYLLRVNPRLMLALRLTYRHVFLDEFQDTTRLHYGLLRRAFMGSETVMTAVGDHKQRIMLWAGAMPTVLEQYTKDFNAQVRPIKRNYRSARVLVATQSIVARSIDRATVDAIAMDQDKVSPGECRVYEFKDEDREAQYLATEIQRWITKDGLLPRDICILFRARPDMYTSKVRSALNAIGVKARVENEFQDVLAEPLVEYLLDVLKLASRRAVPESWERVTALSAMLSADTSEAGMRKAVDLVLRHVVAVNKSLALPSASAEEVGAVLQQIMEFIGIDAFKAAHPRYAQGDYYDRTLAHVVKWLSEARAHMSWSDAIDDVEGLHCVPVMSTHKSKGLEFHTIVFVGLEDDALFGFARQQTEETCGLFVALSRAKKRAIFTFSRVRTTGRRPVPTTQSRMALAPLYDLFNAAGIAVELP